MLNKKQSVKILFSGGGTAGSVTPLLAIADGMSDSIWIGTHKGVEKEMVEEEGIKFISIYSGKWRRYFSFLNFIDLFFIIIGFFQSIFIILKERPFASISAGGFVSVPVVWASWVCRVPVLIHQQDAMAGLANRLMAPCAKIITVTFEKSLKDYSNKATWLGNPIRPKFLDIKISRREALQKIGLSDSLPAVLIMGGGTGAQKINDLVYESRESLEKFCQIIHITGKGKNTNKVDSENYRAFEFVDTFGMLKAYTVADIVVTRCGMGALTEISALGKPAILIPMPDSHQEDNAKIFEEKEAGIVLDQKKINKEDFIVNIKSLLENKSRQESFKSKIKDVIKIAEKDEVRRVVEKLLI
ncbi:MAG: UDP-N-acetylglucosamine--N-acetylmuramyl-(pentapeptide) pyrophosphoryl-undecaprenol N-acetylglucosamine transferase [bacterium]